jgi:hypothetical protein
MDSVVASGIEHVRDSHGGETVHARTSSSAATGPSKRNGKKYGIDQQAIRLGKISIPTRIARAAAAQRAQGNPIAAERDRQMASMRAEIHVQARVR